MSDLIAEIKRMRASVPTEGYHDAYLRGQRQAYTDVLNWLVRRLDLEYVEKTIRVKYELLEAMPAGWELVEDSREPGIIKFYYRRRDVC